MTGTHWAPPDVAGVIIAEALRPGTARAIAVHVRPELYQLLRRQASEAPCVLGEDTDRWNGIRLVVDDQIPASPGYEIHRAVAPISGRLASRPPADPQPDLAAAEGLAA